MQTHRNDTAKSQSQSKTPQRSKREATRHRPGVVGKRLTADFSSDTTEARKKNCLPRILQAVKQSFKNGEIETFPDKQNLGEFAASKPALEEMRKGVLQDEMKVH